MEVLGYPVAYPLPEDMPQMPTQNLHFKYNMKFGYYELDKELASELEGLRVQVESFKQENEALLEAAKILAEVTEKEEVIKEVKKDEAKMEAPAKKPLPKKKK